MIFLTKMLIKAILRHFWPVFSLIWPRYQFLKISMGVFDLVLTGLSEISEKVLIDNVLFDKNANFCHFWPVFGLIWSRYQFPKISTSIFDPVLTGLSEIREKILIANDLFDKNANFGHFGPFLACF